jgi:hypothetical protein
VRPSRSHHGGVTGCSQTPACSWGAFEEAVGVGVVGGGHFGVIPDQLGAGAVGDVAEVVGFGEGTGVAEGAAGAGAVADGIQPFLMMARGVGDEGGGWGETGEVGFGQELVFAVVGDEHAFGADEQDAAGPLRDDGVVLPGVRFGGSLMPVDAAGGELATDAVLVSGGERGGGDLGMRGRAKGFDGQRSVELQRPERQVIPVGAEVRHGAIAKVPPAIPFGPGEIDVVVRAEGGGADPEIPIEVRRRGLRFSGAVGDVDDVLVGLGLSLGLKAPGAGDADMGVGDIANGSRLNELDDAAVVGRGVDLCAHLRGDAGFGGSLSDEAGFGDVVGEGLFTIDRLFQSKRGQVA